MKIRRTDYTFDASAKTLTFTDAIELEGFLLITNVTDNVIIYNFADSAKGGSVTGLVLTLDFDTTTMADADEIQVLYEDTVSLATEANQQTDALTDTELRATPVPISGTVTADLGATDNAVLDSIAAKDFATQTTLAALNAKLVTGTDIGDVTINNASGGSAVNIQDGGNSITVDGTVAVTGVATAANQSTTNGLLTTIDADTSDIHTNTDSIAAGYATEGSALGSGVLMQGDDGTDRTNVLVDTSGHLQVDVLTMPAGGSGLTDAELRATPVPVSGTVTANLSATDNAVLDQIELNQDSQTTLLTAIDADTSNLSTIETNTDYGTVTGGGTETGALRVTLANNSTGVVSVDDNGGSLTVDGSVSVTGSVTVDLGANNDVTVTSGTITANLGATDNAVLDQIELNQDSQTTLLTAIDADTSNIATAVQLIDNAISGSEMQVDVVAPLPAGTNNIGDVDVLSAIITGGSVAHDSADSANPIKVGGQARTSNPAAVADADRVNFIADKLGKQVVVGSIRDLKIQQKTTITSSTSETTILTAAASTFHDVYGLIITNTSAAGTKVTIKDATAGTTRMTFWVPANDTRGFMLPESAAHNQAAVNNNWTATCGTSVADVEITVFAVKNI